MRRKVTNTAFAAARYELGACELVPFAGATAQMIAPTLAGMPPWSVLGWTAEAMERSLLREMPALARYEVRVGDALAGIVFIQDPFLLGPYLQRLALLPEYQGKAFGACILQWMEARARTAHARQLWLCVSSFNVRARAFYKRFGFEEAAVLDELAADAFDEILMRKRLRYG